MSLRRRVVGVINFLFWASVALIAVWMVLGWATPRVRDTRSFLNSGGALLALVMVTSAVLFWQEVRANRQELRAIRRQSRAIRVEGNDEWPPKAWLYATALGLSFFVSWYLLPALLLS